MLTWETLEGSYPSYPTYHELSVTENDMDCLMDIAAYVQIGPHTINGKNTRDLTNSLGLAPSVVSSQLSYSSYPKSIVDEWWVTYHGGEIWAVNSSLFLVGSGRGVGPDALFPPPSISRRCTC